MSIIVAGAVGFLVVTGLRHAGLMVAASVVSGVILNNSLEGDVLQAKA